MDDVTEILLVVGRKMRMRRRKAKIKERREWQEVKVMEGKE